jgi:hypothetical protein
MNFAGTGSNTDTESPNPSIHRSFADIAQPSKNAFLMVSLEAMHSGADNPAQMIHRRRIETLRPAPRESRIGAVLRLWIERQYLLVQPVTQPLEVGRVGRPKPKITADRLPVTSSLATVQLVVHLHELQLQSEPEPALVGHAG